jgi:hypothetical protein
MAIIGMATQQLSQGRRNSRVCNHQEKSWIQSFGAERFCSCEILA